VGFLSLSSPGLLVLGAAFSYLQLAYRTAVSTEHVTPWQGEKHLIDKLLQGPDQLHWNTLIQILQINAFKEYFSLTSSKAMKPGVYLPYVSVRSRHQQTLQAIN